MSQQRQPQEVLLPALASNLNVQAVPPNVALDIGGGGGSVPGSRNSYGTLAPKPTEPPTSGQFAIQGGPAPRVFGSSGSRVALSSSADSRKAIASLVGEFLGTFVLVFTIGCCNLCGDPTWNPTAIASVLMVLIYALEPVSGGSFNPAVTIALGLTRKLEWRFVISHLVMELLAGFLAGLCCSGLFRKSVVFGPRVPFSGWEAGAVEIFFTCLLCFVFLNCYTSKRNNPRDDGNQFFGLAMGFAMIAGCTGSAPIAGIALNPAVSLGLDLTGYDESWYWGLHYTALEFFGALIAAILFRICRREDFIPESEYRPLIVSRLCAEFVGTFTLVFTAGVAMVTKQSAAAWAAGSALTCVTYSLANVSGGHFNPAVTLAVVLSGRGKCKLIDGLFYVMVQLISAYIAALAYNKIRMAGPFANDSFGLMPQGEYVWGTALTVEMLFTGALALVFLSVATAPPPPSLTRQNFYYAMAVGFLYTAGGIAIGNISGGAMNPAVALGTMAASGSPIGNFLSYSIVQVAGSIFAVFVFMLTYPDEYPMSLAKLI